MPSRSCTSTRRPDRVVPARRSGTDVFLACLSQRRPLEVAFSAFHKQEDVFVGSPRPVFRARLGGRVGPLPDDIGSQHPAPIDHLQRHPPGHAQERLLGYAEAARVDGPMFSLSPTGVLPVAAHRATLARVIRVAEVEEQHAPGVQHSPHLVHHTGDRADGFADLRLAPELPHNPVVSPPVIRRRRDNGGVTARRKLTQHVRRVAPKNPPRGFRAWADSRRRCRRVMSGQSCTP